jgi:flavin-dependent dehydrogenase
MRVVGQKEDSDSLTLIESVVDGWWYTALLPNKRRVVVYFTDAGTEASKSAGNEGGYMALLEKTRYIRRRITMNNYTIECCPRITSANSSRLEHIFGDGWLACGDAAASFDPLSSQGILTAIYSGIKAGRALHLSMSGALHTLDLYCRNLNAIYDIYLRNRKIYYSSERRWPESEFWRRRQGAEEKDEG